MSLLDYFIDIVKEWKNVFPKTPSYERATSLAFASLCTFGRACISRFICFLGLDQQDWSLTINFFLGPLGTHATYLDLSCKELLLISMSFT